MIPTPGQKVWVDAPCAAGPLAAGTYAAIVRGPERGVPGYWDVDLEDVALPSGAQVSACQSIMRPRDDPPPQQEPWRTAIREREGSWDALSGIWKPERETA